MVTKKTTYFFFKSKGKAEAQVRDARKDGCDATLIYTALARTRRYTVTVVSMLVGV